MQPPKTRPGGPASRRLYNCAAADGCSTATSPSVSIEIDHAARSFGAGDFGRAADHRHRSGEGDRGCFGEGTAAWPEAGRRGRGGGRVRFRAKPLQRVIRFFGSPQMNDRFPCLVRASPMRRAIWSASLVCRPMTSFCDVSRQRRGTIRLRLLRVGALVRVSVRPASRSRCRQRVRRPMPGAALPPTTSSPTGIGEPGVPPIGPALANAYAAATGRFITTLPIGKNEAT